MSARIVELQPMEVRNGSGFDKQSHKAEKPEEAKEMTPVAVTISTLPSTSTRDLSQPTGGQRHSFKQQIASVFKPKYRRSVILGVGVPIVTQLIGINVLGSYSTTIFEDAGMNRAIIGSVMYGAGDIVGSIVSVFLFDKFGRKTMAYISFSGMSLAYLGLALSDLATSSIAGPLSVVFAQLFVLSFAVACGTLNVAYAPEVVPPEIAGVVLGLGQSLSLFVTFILVLVFPAVLDAIGALGTFMIFFFFCILSLAFLKTFMIETKGRELEDIMAELVQA